MTITHYLDLHQLLERKTMDREANRAFGLEHEEEKPLEQLDAWRRAHLSELDRPRWGETFARYRYGIGLAMGVVAFVVGLLSGAALLSYSGKEPVNVVYFLAMAVVIPLVTMGLAMLSMLRAGSTHNALVHLSPASWMEKIVQMFPSLGGKRLSQVRFHPLLANWLVIERAQMMALWFAIGLLLALVGIVVTQDIAFAWSTTLSVSSEQFHGWLETLAAPWRAFLSSAVPSAELIEQSQYYRLGGKLDAQMVHRAARLGEWWKFLAVSTLFYAVGLRLIIWIVAKVGLRRASTWAILSLEGAQELFRQINTPMVTTASRESETTFERGDAIYAQRVSRLESRYDTVLGWAMNDEGIRVTLDALSVAARSMDDVGGTNTLSEDETIIAQTSGHVLLLVKSWEPPTMDFVDFLTELSDSVERVTVAPVGTGASGYDALPAEVAVWGRKLATLNRPKVWLWTH